MKFLRILFIAIAVAFGLLLLVGFDNVFAVLRSRVTIFLAVIPLFALFIWLVYKAVQTRKRLPQPPSRDAD